MDAPNFVLPADEILDLQWAQARSRLAIIEEFGVRGLFEDHATFADELPEQLKRWKPLLPDAIVLWGVPVPGTRNVWEDEFIRRFDDSDNPIEAYAPAAEQIVQRLREFVG